MPKTTPYPPCTVTAFWLKNRDSARCLPPTLRSGQDRVTQPSHIAGPLGGIIRTAMKGKDTFTKSEILELKNLIKERICAEKSKQKGIRAKMRKIGLYGSDDFGIHDMQPSDFERLIRTGRIKVVGQKTIQKIEPTKQIINSEFFNILYPKLINIRK